MRIQSVSFPPPPREIVMRFTQDEGWAVLGALNEWVAKHPTAARVALWREWAKELDKELRR